MKSIDLLEMLTADAKQYRKTATQSVVANRHMNNLPHTTVPQDIVDAVLVDYINYIANKLCVDYALYTKDLEE